MVITLNRPDAMNAINGALSNRLWNAIEELDGDDSLVAGVITGSGRAFCAGMDLKAFARGEDIGPLNKFVRRGAEKPLIAAVNGFALAGGGKESNLHFADADLRTFRRNDEIAGEHDFAATG